MERDLEKIQVFLKICVFLLGTCFNLFPFHHFSEVLDGSSQVNHLDVELVKFAREEFRSRYGMPCQEMP